MNGDTHEKPTDACLFETDTPSVSLSSATLDLLHKHHAGESPTDVLAQLDRVLAATPEYCHLVFPLKRRFIADVAAEIRTLRAVLAVSTSPGKTQPAAVLLAALETPALTTSAGDVTDGGQL